MGERILVVGNTPAAAEIAGELERQTRHRYVLAGVLEDGPAAWADRAGCGVREWRRLLEGAVRATRPDRIVVALAERRGHASMRALLDVCTDQGIPAEEATTMYERLTGRVAIDALSPNSIVFSWSFRTPRVWAVIARALSFALAIVVLAAAAPLLASIALAIRLDSKGPVLFVQERIGARGRPFRLLKFRTMRVAEGQRSEWERDNRDRVTRVGRWLRRFRLDELPQLVNVIRGEMNLVGPRPHPVSNRELFTLVARNLNERTGSPVAYYALRSMVKPGLTGWAQVRYRYANDLEEEIEKLRYDLYYVKHQSPWLDLRILFDTFTVLVAGHRAAPAPAARGRETLRPVHAGRTPA